MTWYPCTCGAEHDTPTCPFGAGVPATSPDRAPEPVTVFQVRVDAWLSACFGPAGREPIERNHRFLEEALELVQACGCTASEAHQLVDYVFGRPVGSREDEVGGTLTTLAALCLAQGLDMHTCGDRQIARNWQNINAIRAKRAAKPAHSPLPSATPEPVTVETHLLARARRRVPCLPSDGDTTTRADERLIYQLADALDSLSRSQREAEQTIAALRVQSDALYGKALVEAEQEIATLRARISDLMQEIEDNDRRRM